MFTKRALISTVGGVGVSLLAYAMGESGQSFWRFFLDLPGFFVAAFTPGFGVHGNPRALNALMMVANAIFYGLIMYWIYPTLIRGKPSD